MLRLSKQQFRSYKMQFQINITCTPEEARKFFGVPDMLPMQQALLDQINGQLQDNLKTMAPEDLMQTWVPALFQGWSEIQQTMWKQMMNNVNVKVNTSDGDETKPSPKSSKK
jgi:hypothetical protein